MTDKAKTKMIAKPDWMIYEDPSDMFDVERQGYMMLALEQKFNDALKSNDVTKFYEIVFHFLNINALKSDRKLYDEHFKEIQGNKYLAAFVEDMGTDKDGAAQQVINKIHEVYTRIMSAYLKLAISTIADASAVYFDPQNMHYYNTEAFVLFNIKPHEEYELWKVMFRTEIILGSAITKMKRFSGMKAGQTEELREYVNAYNEKNPDAMIRSGNFCTVTCEKAKDAKSVVSVIKDVILLNKIFYNEMQFNPKVLYDIQQIIIDKKTFPFKLLLQ